MNFPYHILTDASADLTKKLIDREEIAVVPMAYQLGEEDFICSGFTPPEELKRFYDEARRGTMTRTSQISPVQYEEIFREYAAKGEPVLYLSLSGGLSGTYGSAHVAAAQVAVEFPEARICCVDSRSATVGLYLLVEAAAQNRAAGMSLEENAAWLEEHRLEVCHWFMVDDLMYLKRNGRISPAVAFVGAALNMKPILRIENDGALVNFTKKRGARAAQDHLIELYGMSSRKERGERVCIVHADNPEAADYLERGVKKLNPHCKIVRLGLTPVIGCHTGPGMCAIAHFGTRIPG